MHSIIYDPHGIVDSAWERDLSNIASPARRVLALSDSPDAGIHTVIIAVPRQRLPESARLVDQVRQHYSRASVLIAIPEQHPVIAGSLCSGETASRALIGNSTVMECTRARLKKIAVAGSNALISGESGTGKELAAALIHNESSRRFKPMISINCAAIPESLFESELFGYEKGAFTGANRREEGKFLQADGSTLFLDEIGDMSPSAQAKILRVIETKQVYRLGGRGSVPVDVRLIAATNRPLEELVSTERFREDLYFRLNVVQVKMPALRDRVEDLPILIRHYLREFNTRFGRTVDSVAESVMEKLRAYKWPGNVRELRNLMEATFVNEPDRVITENDLPEEFRRKLDPIHEASAATAERERLLAALAATNWNKSKAAGRLQWSRVTLYRKMAKYHLAPDSVNPVNVQVDTE